MLFHLPSFVDMPSDRRFIEFNNTANSKECLRIILEISFSVIYLTGTCTEETIQWTGRSRFNQTRESLYGFLITTSTISERSMCNLVPKPCHCPVFTSTSEHFCGSHRGNIILGPICSIFRYLLRIRWSTISMVYLRFPSYHTCFGRVLFSVNVYKPAMSVPCLVFFEIESWNRLRTSEWLLIIVD